MKNAVLWKRILNEGLRHFAQPDMPRISESEVSKIITSTIIVAPQTPMIESSWLDLRNIAPPFKRFWIEGTFESDGIHHWGCLFNSTATDTGFDLSVVCCHADQDFAPEETGRIRFAVDKAGNPEPDRFECDLPPRFTAHAGGEMAAKAAVSYPALAAGLALMILNCKNVSLEPRDHEPSQVRRAIKRHGGNADKYRYHVLVVRPAGSKPGTKGEEIGIMPRHVCRGHFSEYGPEFGKGLLFGKYAGRFYVPPHMKGDKKNGEVAKDYALPSKAEVPGA